MTQNLYRQKTVQNFSYDWNLISLKFLMCMIHLCIHCFICPFFLLEVKYQKTSSIKSWPTPCSFAVWPQEGGLAPQILCSADNGMHVHRRTSHSDKGGRGTIRNRTSSFFHSSLFQWMWLSISKSAEIVLVESWYAGLLCFTSLFSIFYLKNNNNMNPKSQCYCHHN